MVILKTHNLKLFVRLGYMDNYGLVWKSQYLFCQDKVAKTLEFWNLYFVGLKVNSYKSVNSRCLVFKNIRKIDIISTTVREESFKIDHRLGCSDKCLIYLLTCKVCKEK